MPYFCIVLTTMSAIQILSFPPEKLKVTSLLLLKASRTLRSAASTTEIFNVFWNIGYPRLMIVALLNV